MDEREKRREAELEKGRQIGARAALQQEFDPDYRPNSGIAPEERRRRDEATAQRRRGRGE